MNCSGNLCGCRVCGKVEFMPWTCRYCGGVFCNKHRVPEKHNCPDAPEKANYVKTRHEHSGKRPGGDVSEPNDVTYYV
jgi:predicted nucleic acid binding AN1-type Zn finger protein